MVQLQDFILFGHIVKLTAECPNQFLQMCQHVFLCCAHKNDVGILTEKLLIMQHLLDNNYN